MLETMDEFCKKENWPINVTGFKGEILNAVIRSSLPWKILEIGTHYGYTTVNLQSKIPKQGKIITISVNERMQKVAKQVAKFSNVYSKIEWVLGELEDVIYKIKEDFPG